MFGILFLKECKEILKSITYYIFVICMVVFFISQMGNVTALVKPDFGEQSYGEKYSSDESLMIEATMNHLFSEMKRESFVTYPIGFYKKVTLNQEEMTEIYQVLEEITEKSSTEIKKIIENWEESIEGESLVTMLGMEILTFDNFTEAFQKIDDVLGGGSNYAAGMTYKNASVEVTYEEALESYESILNEDQVSRAYARLFADYMGIMLAILPIFLVVTCVLKDRRAKAQQVIYSKKGSSLSIVLARYLAVVGMVLIPILVLSINPLLQSMYIANSNGVIVDFFAFIKIIVGWLLPIILTVTSVGFVLTELTNGPIAILVQGIWWFVSLFLGNTVLVGGVGKNLIPRFNSFGDYKIYENMFHKLVINRVSYVVGAIVLMAATVVIYDLKRKGKLNQNGKIFQHSKSKF